MRRQLASLGLCCLVVVVFCLPELVILPNLGADDLRWPYLLSMIAASVVIYLIGRQTNRREVLLHIARLRLEYWAFILLGAALLIYILFETGILS